MLIHRHTNKSDTARDSVPPLPNSNHNTMAAQQPKSKWHKRLEGLVEKVAIPLNNLATNRGCESFVPRPMELECAKAARILRSFAYHPAANDVSSKPHLVTVPSTSLASAVGVIVFTTGRLGLSKLSGSTGSGLLITRNKYSQGWNYPLAIQTHGVGLGLLAWGFDVSDRVYLVHSTETLDKILNSGRFMVGPEAVLAVGKWGGGGGVTFSASYNEVKDSVEKGKQHVMARTRGRSTHGQEAPHAGVEQVCQHCQTCPQHHNGDNDIIEDEKSEKPTKPVAAEQPHSPPVVHIDDLVQQVPEPEFLGASEPVTRTGHAEQTSGRTSHPPIYCYMRSHGLYAGLQAEGTVISERHQTNDEFYSRPGAIEDTPAWRDGPEMKAVEDVWNALKELEFGLQG